LGDPLIDQTREVNRSAVTSFLKLAEALAAPRLSKKYILQNILAIWEEDTANKITKIGAENCA